jgi:peptidoglycan/xylan/chitin deacetylase (PgdA/CDA1 family)
VKACFFVIGSHVAEPAPGIIARAARDEGHWIGNHTFSHKTPLGELDPVAAVKEFESAERELEWLDQPVRLFRPYGRRGLLGPHLLQPAVVEKLQTGGYTCVLWKWVSGDWMDPNGWVQRALAECRASEWSMVVLHDTPSGAMLHLDTFLRSLEEEEFEITQEFPPDCLPIVNGRIVLPIESYSSNGILK